MRQRSVTLDVLVEEVNKDKEVLARLSCERLQRGSPTRKKKILLNGMLYGLTGMVR